MIWGPMGGAIGVRNTPGSHGGGSERLWGSHRGDLEVRKAPWVPWGDLGGQKGSRVPWGGFGGNKRFGVPWGGGGGLGGQKGSGGPTGRIWGVP